MKLNLGALGSDELKQLSKDVESERKRRGKKNPANHEPPLWVIPNKAIQGERQSAA